MVFAWSLLTAVALAEGGAAATPRAPGVYHGFVRNAGQVFTVDGDACPDVLYSASQGNVHIYLTSTGLSYVLSKPMEHEQGSGCETHAHDDPCENRVRLPEGRVLYRTDIVFEGARNGFTVDEEFPGSVALRRYTGRGAALTELQSFKRIIYRDVYPGIDALFTLAEKGLKYEFYVHPGADPAAVQLHIDGASSLDIIEGNLHIETPLGSLTEQAPITYAVATGAERDYLSAPRTQIASAFRLRGNRLSFDIDPVAKTSGILIDPFVQWSTYLGSDGFDAANTAGFLPNGDIIAAGFTSSQNFPTTPGVLQEAFNNSTDGFITRFTPDGTIVWSTFLGGDIQDVIMALDVDVNGEIVVGGYTSSSTFPTTSGAFQENIAGGYDVFLAKINPAGQLVWATLFGGGLSENLEGLATDSRGDIAFTGYTHSSNLPRTANGFQLVFAGNRDAYIAKFRANGTRMWASYYGGDLEDWGHSVSIDNNNNIYFVGHTHSYNFPSTPGSYQDRLAGDRDGFLVKFAPDGSRISGSLIGTTDWDDTYGVAADPTGHVAVVGATGSPRFPVTPGAIQSTHVRYYDGVVMRFRENGTLYWSTYLGSDAWDLLYTVDVYPSGNIMVAGVTESPGMYASPGAFQTSHGGGEFDMYVTKITADGRRRYATFLGGASIEFDRASSNGLPWIATSPRGEAVLAGRTSSVDFPTLLPHQTDNAGNWDATVTKWTCTVEPAPFIIASGPVEFCMGDSVTLEVPPGYQSYKWSTGETTRSITVSTNGTYYASVADTADCFADTPPVTVKVNPLPTPQISPAGPIDFCLGDTITLDAGAGYDSYLWSNGFTERTIRVAASDTLSVTVWDSFGCSAASPQVVVIMHPLPVPVIAPQGPTEFCSGESVVLDAGAGFTTYEWSTGDTTRTLLVQDEGVYNVRVTNEFGCEAIASDISVTVYPLPEPKVTPNGPTSFCLGDSVILDAGAGYMDYLWSTGATSRTITVSEPGSYKVTVVSDMGCTDSSSAVDVRVFPLPEPVITALGPTEFCEDETTTLDAGPGFASYRWSTGETSQRITVNQSGTYNVTVSTGEGCSAVSPDVEITVYPLPVPVVDPGGTIAFCEGDSATLTVNSGYASYLWSTGETGTSITVTQPGTYSVVATTAFGCEATSNVVTVVVYPLPPKPGITQRRDTLHATPGAAGYIWYLDGVIVSGETSDYLLIPRAGEYLVAALSPQGCITLSDPYEVVIASMRVSLPDIIMQPGQTARIPLLVESSNLIVESGAKNFIATISFAKNILADIAPETGWTMDATSRRIRLNGSWDAVNGELASFEVMAMLGPVKSVDLVIEDIDWLEGIVAMTTENGSVTLDACEEGGDRLFDDAGQVQLAQNSPNPFNGMTVLRYKLIERGQTQLYVTDVLGRRITTLYSGYAVPGTFETRFDATGLPTGRYFAVLQTPTVTKVRLMQLVK